MVSVPLKKKKKIQVSSPGRAPPAQDRIKEREGCVFFTQNPPPPPLSKTQKLRDLPFLRPQATFCCILLSFLILLLTPTSKYLIFEFSSFPLMYLGLLLVL